MCDPLISVIVPVYKTEQYLDQCIASIRNQTYQNLEIILVDDGSPDRCGEKCDAYAREDSRIRVFHKENGGQSSARNLGLDQMTGQYVGFVDSDDWIEPDMYRKLYDRLASHNAQISACGCQLDFPDGSKTWFNRNYMQDNSVKIYDTREALEQSIWNQILTYSLCDKLFQADIFDGLRMTEGKIYEDQEIIPHCIERAQTVVYDPEPGYHYRRTLESTTRGTFTPLRYGEADLALSRAQEYKNRYPELYESAMAYYITVSLAILPYSKGAISGEERRRAMIRELKGPLDKGIVSKLPRNTAIKLRALRLGEPVFDLLMALVSFLKR